MVHKKDPALLKEDTPRVSFITINFNGAGYLRGCIESVLSQTYDSWEHIIVDCGSTDDSLMVLDQLYHDKLKIIKLDVCCGLSFARNTAIEHSEGEFCAILDVDDEAMPKRLAAQLNILDTDSSIIAVGGNAIIRYSNNRRFRKYFLNNHTHHYLVSCEDIRAFCLACLNSIPHSILTFRKSAFDSIGGYLESQERAEDFDLVLRLALYGRIVGVNETIGVIRSSHPGSYGCRNSGFRDSHFYCCRAILMSFTSVSNRTRVSSKVNDWLDLIGKTGRKALHGKWLLGQLLFGSNKLRFSTYLRLAKEFLAKVPSMLICCNQDWMWGSYDSGKFIKDFIDLGRGTPKNNT